MNRLFVSLFIILLTSISAFAETARHNLIFFIADGLCPGLVAPETAPTLARLMAQGVKIGRAHV